ncbi:MAG: ankyrin repeat domain-containing protein [Armatimonas sp.]
MRLTLLFGLAATLSLGAVPALSAPMALPRLSHADDGAEAASRSKLISMRLPEGAYRSTAQDDIEALRQALMATAQTNHGKIDSVEVLVWSGAANPMSKLAGSLKEAGYNYVTRTSFQAEPGKITPVAAVRKDKKNDLLGMWIETPNKMVMLVWGIYRPDNTEKPGTPVDSASTLTPASPGATFIQEAIQQDTADALRAQLQKGANPNGKTPDGRPLLLSVVAQGGLAAKAEKVEALLDAGANPNQGDDNGFTPLYAASLTGDTTLMELLVKKGAKVDGLTSKGNTSLHGAIAVGKTEAAIWLLEHGANPSIRSKGGQTARELAEQMKNDELVGYLGSIPAGGLTVPKPTEPVDEPSKEVLPQQEPKPSAPAASFGDPNALQGEWNWTTISSVTHIDKIKGTLTEPSGMSVKFSFLPNGRYKMFFFVHQRTYNLVTESSTTEEGKITFGKDTFVLTPTKGHYKGFTGSRVIDRDMTAAERKTKTYYWEWRTVNGKRQLYMGPSAQAMSPFKRP